jgi:NAD(P)-dependent dehydrogenase (short-subunit alcohol dehydrogenase family)
MEDKVILITGSTDGIGKQIAIELAGMGATILLHGRNQERVDIVKREIIRITGNDRIESYVADFSSIRQVKDFVRNIDDKHDRIDVLINNAGVYEHRRRITEDGLEMTFEVNHLASFILTLMLLDLIGKSDYKRIIIVSSMAHASRIDISNLLWEKSYSGYDAYALSKLCNILFTFELADKLKGTGITVNCLHPGAISTKLLHAGWRSLGAPVSQGAVTPVFLATSSGVKDITGKFFVNKRIANPPDIANDKEVREKIWMMSEELSGVTF